MLDDSWYNGTKHFSLNYESERVLLVLSSKLIGAGVSTPFLHQNTLMRMV